MALRDHLPRWLKRRLLPDSNVQAIHDALEATLRETADDLARTDADTVIETASELGLERWGVDLAETKRPGMSIEQRRANIKGAKQGIALNDTGIRYALDKWELPYRLVEFGDASTFWDRGFYDRNAVSVPPLQIRIEFADPFGGATPTAEQKAEALQRINNAVLDVGRVKARGVRVVAVVPPSLL